MPKICPTCGGHGPFSKDSTKGDGLSRECKLCAKARVKAWRDANHQRSLDSHKAWREAHPQKVKENNQAWYASHRQAEIARTTALAKGNRARVNASQNARANQRRQLIQSAKSGPCLDCGETFPHYCMDLDHVRGEKRQILAWMYTYSAGAILSEIQKCDLVCANCHKIRTDSRRPRTKVKRRLEFNQRLLPFKSKPCTDCGRGYPAFVMEFDHVRGPKVNCVALMKHSPWGKVLVEISKCELVCACCHRKRTHERRHHSPKAA